MGTVFLNVLHMSLAAALMAVAVMVVRFLLNKLLPNTPKAIHCALWALVALRLVLPVSVESPFSLIPADVAQGEVLSEWRDAYTGTTITIFDQTEGYDEAVAAGREPYYAGEGGHYYVVTGEDGISAPDTVETTKIPALGWIWLAGVVVMVAYAAFSFFRIRRRVRLSIPLRDNILRCEQVDSPFILGLFRPKIYLPYDMDEEQSRHVIAHEEAHLRRRDHWWKPLGFLLLAVYWFNPVLWAAYILLCRDIELACDERVIREMDNTEKKAYSEALLQCSLPRRMVAACPLAFGEVGVKERIASVLHYKKPAFWVVAIAVVACLVVVLCFLTNPKEGVQDILKPGTEWISEEYQLFFSVDNNHVIEGTLTQQNESAVISVGYRFAGKYNAVFEINRGDWEWAQSSAETPLLTGILKARNDTLILEVETDAVGFGAKQIVFINANSETHNTTPESEAIWSRAETSSPTEMMAYLCQADLWNDAIGEQHEISMVGNFDTTVWFSAAPANPEALDLAMARRACVLMRLYPDEVFYVMWSYPDGNGGTAHREFHADEMAAIIGLSSHTGVIAQPDSAKDVEMQLGFLGSLDEKLFIKWAAEGNTIGGADGPTNILITSALTPEAAGRLLDVIVSSPTEASSLAAYMGVHPTEVETLLMNPEPTLEYIFTQFLNGGQTDLKGSLMRLVLDELAPEAQLRLYAETGQEYFDAWMKGADQMATDHGLEWLEVNQSAMYQMLCIRSELYGHSSPMEAVKLPKAVDLDTMTYRAACDAILNSLRTGWWTGSTLDPSEEAAAFTCFFRLDADGVIKLYGYGGYFSRDAAGNDADEWSSFCIVTLNKTTMDMIQVWWPGDGAYHDMSITENFPEDLGFAALNATPQELQTLHKQLKKQAAGNMNPVGLQSIA